MRDLIARHDRRVISDAEQIEGRARTFHQTTGGNRPGNPGIRQCVEQVPGTGQRAHLRQVSSVGLTVPRQKTCDFLRGKPVPRFMKERVDEQSSAHANAPVNAPDGKGDPSLLESFPPGKHVLVDTIDERAVEVEEEARPLQTRTLVDADEAGRQGVICGAGNGARAYLAALRGLNVPRNRSPVSELAAQNVECGQCDGDIL